MRLLIAFLLFLAPSAFAQMRAAGAFFSAQNVATTWTPVSISGLKLWYESSSISANNGDLLSSWTDLSANSWAATNATAGEQPYVTNSWFGSYPAIYTDGTKKLWVNRNAMDAIRNVSGATIFGVFCPAAVAGAYRTIFNATISNGSGARAGLFVNNSLYEARARAVDGDAGVSATYAAIVNLKVVATAYANFAGGKVYIRTNGVEIASGDLPHSQNSSDANCQNISLMADASGEVYTGWIGAVLLYSGQMSTSDMHAVESYLGTKYGITIY